MKHISIALDWTPNINHIGFFVTKEKGFYNKLGLDVEIIDPSQDNYKKTPAKKIELGNIDFALCPTESIISYQTKAKPFNLIAVAAILQKDLSAIVVQKSSGIDSPKQLDQKIYSSYKARYEDAIVKEMIKNDGGKGNIKITYPNKLGIWNTLLNNECHATWIFLNWEGIAAKNSTEQLNYFKMQDFKIPYSYSPVIAVSESKILKKESEYIAFLKATKKGYLFCKANPKESIDILKKHIPENEKNIDLNEALKITAPHFGNDKNWGIMDEATVSNFMNWIVEKGLEKNTLNSSKILTNKYLK